MRRSRLRQVWASTFVLGFLIAAVVAAAAGLAYYSYEYAQEMAQRGDTEIVESTRDAAWQLKDRIDSLIESGDSILFGLVDVGKLRDFYKRWSVIGPRVPVVESVIV